MRSYLQKSIHDCSGILVNRCHKRVRRAERIKEKISICLLTTWLINICTVSDVDIGMILSEEIYHGLECLE